jgi:hypothetical protein
VISGVGDRSPFWVDVERKMSWKMRRAFFSFFG